MQKKFELRSKLSYKYITKGKGIEIGPTFLPLKLLPGVKPIYVDTMSTPDLLKLYPTLKEHKKTLVNVDVVDDGEKLEKFEDSSVEFVIANHFIEHTINPIKTLCNFLRVLKKDGIIFLGIPDKRVTFDKDRPLTPVSHFIEVYEKDDDKEIYQHYVDCARLIEKQPEERVNARVQELIDTKFSIHYHTFQKENFIQMIEYMNRKGIGIELIDMEDTQEGTDEFIVVLRKSDVSAYKYWRGKIVNSIKHKRWARPLFKVVNWIRS